MRLSILSLVLAACSSTSPTAPAGADLAVPPSDDLGRRDLAVLSDDLSDLAVEQAPDLTSADAPPPAPIISAFTATPALIPPGTTRTVTLTWSVVNAGALSISGIGAVTGTSTTTSVSAATTFTLTATGAGGVASAMTSVALDNGTLGVYIDPVNGSDTTGNGTPSMPFQSFAKAATGGKTIYASPGTYALSLAAVNLAAGAGVEALTPGSVTLSGGSAPTESYGLTFAGDGFVHGLIMERAFINVSAGTVAIDNTQFVGIYDAGSANTDALNISGTGKVILTPGGLANYLGTGTSAFADLTGSGQLEIHGGSFVNASNNVFESGSLIEANNSSTVLLDGVTIDGAHTGALLVQNTAQVTIQNGSLIRASAQASGGGRASITVTGTPTILIDNSTITASPNIGIAESAGSAPTLTLQNGSVVEKSGANFGIGVAGGVCTLDNTRVSDNLGPGVDVESGTLITKAGTVVKNNTVGIQLRIGNNYTLTMRGTQVINNTNDGLLGLLGASSLIDLGSAATAGGNTFSGNAVGVASSYNLSLSTNLSTADLIVNAAGNTWNPTDNGADGSGHFAGGTTFSAPPTVTGKNLHLTQSGSASFHLSLVATP